MRTATNAKNNIGYNTVAIALSFCNDFPVHRQIIACACGQLLISWLEITIIRLYSSGRHCPLLPYDEPFANVGRCKSSFDHHAGRAHALHLFSMSGMLLTLKDHFLKLLGFVLGLDVHGILT